MPAAAKAARPGSPPGAGSTARTASTASPTTTTLLRVPRPGRSRSGIQASSTSAPTTIVTDPSDHPSRRDSPWWRTSHGITPSEDRTISAIDTPYRTSPAYSCASRRGSLQLVKQLVEEALLAAFLRALAVAAVVVAVLERVGDGLLPATLVVAVAGGRLAALPALLGVDQALELAPVEEDAAAVGALVDGDAAALVGPHEPLALRADQIGCQSGSPPRLESRVQPATTANRGVAPSSRAAGGCPISWAHSMSPSRSSRAGPQPAASTSSTTWSGWVPPASGSSSVTDGS